MTDEARPPDDAPGPGAQAEPVPPEPAPLPPPTWGAKALDWIEWAGNKLPDPAMLFIELHSSSSATGERPQTA
jgi:hypothetical protein